MAQRPIPLTARLRGELAFALDNPPVLLLYVAALLAVTLPLATALS